MAKARGKISKKQKPETDLQEAFHQWLLAMYEFDQWRHQLRVVLDSCTWAVPKGPFIGDHVVIASLRLLDEELMEVVRKLISEVNHMEEHNELDVTQLVAHTNTIHQWSQKIRAILSAEARGIA
ncbi:hypothetical protein [Spirosoma koreense]